jgi:hypothetical protein
MPPPLQPPAPGLKAGAMSSAPATPAYQIVDHSYVVVVVGGAR